METRINMELDTPSYYLVIDIKATSDEPEHPDPQEIIELSVVALESATMQVVGDFQRYVRPEVHPELSPHCVALTGISQGQIEESDVLEDVLSELTQWTGHLLEEDQSVMSMVYGSHTLGRVLAEQAEDEELELPEFLQQWVNLQGVFKRHFALKGYLSLNEACEYLGMSTTEDQASGIDVAHQMTNLFVELSKLDAKVGPISTPKSLRGFTGNVEEKPGDWHCARCQFLNFARRNFCKACGAPRSEASGQEPPEAPDGAWSVGDQEAKPGDWYCSQCNFHNFARRNYCKECGTSRSGVAGEARDSRRGGYGGGGRGGYGGGGRGGYGGGPRMKPGDWRCGDCNYVNFARRSHCKECNAKKPAESDSHFQIENSGRPGDWNCPSCNYLNFAYRDSCGRCHEPKPS